MSEARLRLQHFWAAVMVVVFSALASSGQQALNQAQTSDPATTLQSTRERVLADLARLPRYTCVQTITRRHYLPQFRVRQPSCADLIVAHQERTHELPLLNWDRLRLEVAIADAKNVYSWVGAPKFEESFLEKLAEHRPLWSGDFGTFLNSIFRRATVSFQKEEVVNGRRLLKYFYDMPADRSGYQIKTSEGSSFTAYNGIFLLDPSAADIVNVTVRTAELPDGNPACQAIAEVEYARTSIHDRMVLIPSETRLRMINRDGSETLNRTAYANCREYASTSRLLFDAPQSNTGTAVTPPSQLPPPNPLPAGLHFDCRIVTPIDSDTAAAGDTIEAVLRSPIRDKKNGVLAPAGTRLHGRLLEIEYRGGLIPIFQIVVQFETIELNGRNVPFSAAPESTPLERGFWMRSYPGSIPISPDHPTEIGTFIFRQEHLRLQQFDWRWTTLSPDSNGK